ncbi:MAG: EAL and HDOD domain-containing protein [Pseudomonadales bacterium]
MAKTKINPHATVAPKVLPRAEQALFAQQPILDGDLNLVAYELLFRGDFDQVDGYSATARVFLNAFDKGHFLADGAFVPLFVNFTEDLLFQLPPFDTDSFVIELLETIEPTEQVVEQVRLLKQHGYRIALDDFVYSDAHIPLLECADIVKIDVMETDSAEVARLVAVLEPYNVTLLAEKVEDHATFERCKELGFEWYQGYFFARPKLIEGHTTGPNKAVVLQMVAALQQPDLDMETLEQIISSDTGLAYKVLRLSNSAAVRRAVPIDTIGKAVSMLGLRTLQNFSTLMALSELSEKPPELQKYTTRRGQLCERIGALLPTEYPSALFQSVGILSCCDAYFDDELGSLIANLPLSDSLRAALLDHDGELGLVLQSVIELQEGRWQNVDWSELAAAGVPRTAVLAIMSEFVSHS